MTYAESKKILDEIRNRNHEVVFRMAISHLMDVGIRHLDEENIERTCEIINQKDDSKLGMTNEFLCELVRIAGELAKIDHIHLLVYIQREVFYDVSDNGISYERAIQIIQKCIDWITCDVEFADAIADLNAIGFDEEEIKEFGFNYLFDAEEENEDDIV